MARFRGNLENVDLRLLRVFRAVSECGGLTAASSELGVGRSTISRQLSDLETRLGLRLCERGRAGFRLTDEGRVVLDHSYSLLGSLENFTRHISDIHKELSGELVIAFADTIVWSRDCAASQAINSFSEAAPGVRPSVRVFAPQEVERAVLTSTCQVGVTTTNTNQASLQYQHLYDEENFLFCSWNHALAQSGQDTTLSSLAGETIVPLIYETQISEMISRLKCKRGPTANDMEAVAMLILTGNYLGFMPNQFGRLFVERGQMKVVQSAEAKYNVAVNVITARGQAKTTAISIFLEGIKKSFSPR